MIQGVTQVNAASIRRMLAAIPVFGGYCVPTYRLYRLDGAGRINGADWIEADDDDAVRAAARETADSSSYEVWDRNRLVERVRVDGVAAEPPRSAT